MAPIGHWQILPPFWVWQLSVQQKLTILEYDQAEHFWPQSCFIIGEIGPTEQSEHQTQNNYYVETDDISHKLMNCAFSVPASAYPS